ncbi:MAG: DNA repair protein RecO [Clostridiales bacterium]|nr:DNA repair protein RecO [Clostridiales bacterium]
MSSETRTKGIVIDVKDYREYDKILTIFTYDLGVIKAVIRGVKKSTAKSRFAGQLFCFVDLIMSKHGDMYTIINADLIESFFELAYNYDNYILAVDIIKVIKYVSKYNPNSTELFVVFISILNVLMNTKANSNVVYLKFLVETLKSMGYKHGWNTCERCGNPVDKTGYIDIFTGMVVCEKCNKPGMIVVDVNDMNIIKSVAECDYASLEDISIEEEQGIRILKTVQALFKVHCNQ